MDAHAKHVGPRRAMRILMGIGSAIPFALAMIVHAAGPASQPVQYTEERPALVFDQYLVNLGRVAPKTSHFAHFVFRNRSDRTVKIKELRPSCGCLNPRLEKRVYRPNEAGRFSLRVQAANQDPGPHEYYCKVFYEDPQPRVIDLTFKITLPETVVVQPRALYFYQFNGAPTEQTITVTSYRSKRLELTELQCSSELVEAVIDEPDVDKEGNRQSTVKVTVGKVPPGRHRPVLTILTNDRAFPKLQVPLYIQGPRETPERLGARFGKDAPGARK